MPNLRGCGIMNKNPIIICDGDDGYDFSNPLKPIFDDNHPCECIFCKQLTTSLEQKTSL
jgi:hypothetical protein